MVQRSGGPSKSGIVWFTATQWPCWYMAHTAMFAKYDEKLILKLVFKSLFKNLINAEFIGWSAMRVKNSIEEFKKGIFLLSCDVDEGLRLE